VSFNLQATKLVYDFGYQGGVVVTTS